MRRRGRDGEQLVMILKKQQTSQVREERARETKR